MRVKGLAVLRLLLRIPTLFLVGERPAGALNGELLMVVFSLLIGERASRICLRGAVDDGVVVVVGVRLRKKLVGLWKVLASFGVPSRAFDRFEPRN